MMNRGSLLCVPAVLSSALALVSCVSTPHAQAVASGSQGATTTISGCVAKSTYGPGWRRSPSDYILIETTTSAPGQELGTTNFTFDRKTPPGTPGIGPDVRIGQHEAPGIGHAQNRERLGAGPTYLLDGAGIAEYAGQRVEVSGQLVGITTDPWPTMRVSGMRTIAKTCDR